MTSATPLPVVTARSTKLALRQVYRRLRAEYGHLHWWPGETPFEVCVGAILTQNTSWKNVERAIANLKSAGVLEPQALLALPGTQLAALLRPAGYYNLKARRLRAFVDVLVRECGGDLARFFASHTAAVRQRLLAIHGIGAETADSMLLYAGQHLSFVVDAYTRRIFHRHGWCGMDATYDELQALCTAVLSQVPKQTRLDYWQDYHAQIVMVGKDYCRKRHPRCEACPLRSLLP